MGSSFSKNSNNDLQEKTFFGQVRTLLSKMKEEMQEDYKSKKKKSPDEEKEKEEKLANKINYEANNQINLINSSMLSSSYLLTDINKKSQTMNTLSEFNVQNILDLGDIESLINRKTRLSYTFDDFIQEIENRNSLKLPRVKKKIINNTSSSPFQTSTTYSPYYPINSLIFPSAPSKSFTHFINSFSLMSPEAIYPASNLYFVSAENTLQSIYASNNLNFRDDYIISRLSLFTYPKELTSKEPIIKLRPTSGDSFYKFLAMAASFSLDVSYYIDNYTFSCFYSDVIKFFFEPSPEKFKFDFKFHINPNLAAGGKIKPGSRSEGMRTPGSLDPNSLPVPYSPITIPKIDVEPPGSVLQSIQKFYHSKFNPAIYPYLLLTPPKYSPEFLNYIVHYNKKKGYETFYQLANVYNREINEKYLPITNMNIIDNIIYYNDVEYEIVSDYEVKFFQFLRLVLLSFNNNTKKEAERLLHNFDSFLLANKIELNNNLITFIQSQDANLFQLAKNNSKYIDNLLEIGRENVAYQLYHLAITESVVEPESIDPNLHHKESPPVPEYVTEVISEAIMDPLNNSDFELEYNNSSSTCELVESDLDKLASSEEESVEPVSDFVKDLIAESVDDSSLPTVTAVTSSLFYNLIRDTLLDEEWGIQPTTEMVKSNIPYSKETTKENIKWTITTNLQAEESK